MASEGSAPARALLGRFCSGSGDKEGLVKYWSQDTREDRLEVARDFIVDIDSLEKLRKKHILFFWLSCWRFLSI